MFFCQICKNSFLPKNKKKPAKTCSKECKNALASQITTAQFSIPENREIQRKKSLEIKQTDSYNYNFNTAILKRTEKWNKEGHPRTGMSHSVESKIKIGKGNSGRYKGKTWNEIFGEETANRRRLENSKFMCNTNETLLSNRKSLLEEKLYMYLPSYERNVRIGKYNVDFLDKNNKHIIEIYGDYWHCNPKIYDDDFIHPHHKITSSEKHKRDNIRKVYLEKLGYVIEEVWESGLDQYILEKFTN